MLAEYLSKVDNDHMFWFDIIGLSLGFAGSILFSAGLIKTPEQIQDENTTYFNSNFYTLRAEMSSRKLLIAAFLLLIAGFAVSAGGVIGRQSPSLQVLIGTLIAITLSAVGFLATALFYIHRAKAHQELKYQHAKQLFRSTVEGYLEKWNSIGNLDFAQERKQGHDGLEKRYGNLKLTDATQENSFLKKFKGAKDIDDLKVICENYLQSIDRLGN